jgi:transcriptional regulator with XRE-family HTH domain
MTQTAIQGHLARNLAVLARREKSISELCRSLGLNRQQFNKYLSGQHLPSRRNLSRIAQYFGVSEKDLFARPAEFEERYAGGLSPLARLIAELPHAPGFHARLPETAASAHEMEGVYLRYHCSSIYDKRILRSLVGIRLQDGLMRYRCIELFPDLDHPDRTAYRFRYSGICLVIEDRIFMLDIEDRQLNELTYSILTQIVRKPARFFFGLVMGVAATALREPFATRVALEFRHRGWFRPSDLRLANAMDVDDPAIPSEVKAYLGIGNAHCGDILRGR